MTRHRQSGAVLVLCLILLVALSLLGLAAASDSQFQQRINGNVKQQLPRDSKADSGMNWAQDWLFSLPGQSRPLPCSESCLDSEPVRPAGYYPDDLSAKNLTWWQNNGYLPGYDPDSGIQYPVTDNPQGLSSYWLVEELHHEDMPLPGEDIESLTWYRIAAMAAPAHDGSVKVVESVVARPWGDPAFSNDLPRNPGDLNFCSSLPDSTCGRQAWRALR